MSATSPGCINTRSLRSAPGPSSRACRRWKTGHRPWTFPLSRHVSGRRCRDDIGYLVGVQHKRLPVDPRAGSGTGTRQRQTADAAPEVAGAPAPGPPLAQARRAAVIPFAPGGVGQRLKVGGQRTADLPLMGRDDLLGFADLALQLGDDLLGLLAGLCAGDTAIGEAGRFEVLQGLIVLLDLGPMPGDLAVTVGNHGSLLMCCPSIGDSRPPGGFPAGAPGWARAGIDGSGSSRAALRLKAP